MNKHPRSTRDVRLRLIMLIMSVVAIGGFLLYAPAPALGDTTWNVGDVFVGIRTSKYRDYSDAGTFKQELYDGLDTREVTGCAFDGNDDLYTTNYWQDKVVRYDGNDPQHPIILPHISIPAGDRPESIAFSINEDFYVGEARGNADIRRYDRWNAFQQLYNVAVGPEGADWMTLSSDQYTAFYASEGSIIRRYDLLNNQQGFDFANYGNFQRALKLLPPGDSSAGLIVATGGAITRLDSSGGFVRDYDATGEDDWHTLALDPTGTSFWAGGFSSGNLYRFNLATGNIEVGPIPMPSNVGISGICVKGEYSAAQPQPPLYTKSYYIQSNNPQLATNLGCEARVRGERGIVVLDFGAPDVDLSGSGAYRSILPKTCDPGPCVYASRDQVKSITMEFARGYIYPAACLDSPPYPAPGLVLAVGSSNSALKNALGIWHDNNQLTNTRGQDWAKMIKEIRGKLAQDPNYASVDVVGGYDAEYYGHPSLDCRDAQGHRTPCPSGPPFNPDADEWSVYAVQGSTPTGTKFWEDGYDSEPSTPRLYNFGSCESCPRRDDPTIWMQDPNIATVLSRVFRLNWIVPAARPLPQNYYEPRSYEWYNVRWYGQAIEQRFMSISGVMTQCGSSGCIGNNPTTRLHPRFNRACHPDSACIRDWVPFNCGTNPCPNLPPNPGWQALLDMVSSPARPDGTANPAVTRQLSLLNGVTDIFCQVNCP